jgi:filamentous hemagglutinin
VPAAISGALGAIRGLGIATSSQGGQSETSQQNVQFGSNENQEYHAFRHIDEIGIDRGAATDAIRQDLAARGTIAPNAYITGNVTVGGQSIEYRAFGLSNGTINVGRITGN